MHSECGQMFCSKCIIDKVDKCPLCRGNDLKQNSLAVPKYILNKLDELKVQCSMCKGGVQRGQLKDHQERYCPLLDAYKQVEELKVNLEEEFQKRKIGLERKYQDLMNKFKTEHEQMINQTNSEFQVKRAELVQEFESKDQDLQKLIEKFEKEKLQREIFESSNKPIPLNVGGTILTVSLGDLLHNEREPDNLFKKMLTGQHPLYQTPCTSFKDDVYFINCDPVVFKHILDWLRFGIIDLKEMKHGLVDACQLFQLTNLEKQLLNSQLDLIRLSNVFAGGDLSLNLNGVNMRNFLLQKTNLENSKLSCCNFSGMNIRGCNFKGSTMRGCDFSNCDLAGANFQNCELNSNFLSACFSNSNFENVNFTNTITKKSKFENAKFTKCKIQIHFTKEKVLQNCKFIECDFNGSIFEEIDFKIILHSTNNSFNNCTIKNSDLRNLKDLSNFNGLKFDRCLFDFNGLSNKHIANIQFDNIDLQSQDLSGIIFDKCSLTNIKTNVYFGLVSSIIINECDCSVSSELCSHTCSIAIPQLLYRGTRDGFHSKHFHSKCDLQGPTLTIIKSAKHNQIFGAFTSRSWKSPHSLLGEYVSDESAFIFKIVKDFSGKYHLEKFNFKQNQKQYAICLCKNYLPRFGDVDLDISTVLSSSDFGNTFELPIGLQYGSEEAKSYLAGSSTFQVAEIEVFKITQH
ncbi:hypothetical protein NAEGRDRAFT_80657 [Naegleria gruberi]|uniref:TLDc domain-containing protein n=1 Tax=Naegleria gruberi TaxID=5762 RepID=D2VNL9_NAEGR|nr:uncharacterized protein NAEGRDRAFT_80657 [Naegleria gruberi]EFC41526.1 hypothetical protein NAEGRDRAFT_80657 [Naegleria gruberi]|eukprot:XP_002674270.1 hypothetical protein NAEGRDRAFT_80657 [Naegleria gruberi strain NEG-M]